MAHKVVKTSEIKIKVGLSEHKIPVDIKWMATDSERDQLIDCKAFNLSIWDPFEKDSLAIDLWTEEMRVDEMHTHFFRTIINMATSYQRATGNPFVLEEMKQFCNELAKKTSDWEEERSK